MRIVMATNTYLPHVGGVAKSVGSFVQTYERLGHEVLVVAPEFEGMPEREDDVLRVPAIQHFSGSDFSVRLPVPVVLSKRLETFRPEIIHSHHPFLLGDTALRIAALHQVPLVFTHHTLYEHYTHYVPGDAPRLRRFVIELSTHYANACDHVIAPSQSVAALIRERGVETPVTVIPTGVDLEAFADGDGASFRSRLGIPADAFVVGHVGRLAPEKNLPFLVEAVRVFLWKTVETHFLVAGTGPSEDVVMNLVNDPKVRGRVHRVGALKAQELVDAYHAMDVFAFASTTETQGMVLTEALASGVPLVACDGPGVREVVQDGSNGRLVPHHDVESFVDALQWVHTRVQRDPADLASLALEAAREWSLDRCCEKALALYARLRRGTDGSRDGERSSWDRLRDLIKQEWHLWTMRAQAATEAASSKPEREKLS